MALKQFIWKGYYSTRFNELVDICNTMDMQDDFYFTGITVEKLTSRLLILGRKVIKDDPINPKLLFPAMTCCRLSFNEVFNALGYTLPEGVCVIDASADSKRQEVIFTLGANYDFGGLRSLKEKDSE